MLWKNRYKTLEAIYANNIEEGVKASEKIGFP